MTQFASQRAVSSLVPSGPSEQLLSPLLPVPVEHVQGWTLASRDQQGIVAPASMATYLGHPTSTKPTFRVLDPRPPDPSALFSCYGGQCIRALNAALATGLVAIRLLLQHGPELHWLLNSGGGDEPECAVKGF